MNLLFSPLKIGNIELKNRIVMAPMSLNYSREDGTPSSRQVAYYKARVKGGVGLIISESCYVAAESRGGKRRLGLSSDEMVSGHKRLTSAVHEHGGRIFCQLHHGGAAVSPAASGALPVSASATPLTVMGEPFIGIVPRRLDLEEIRGVTKAFALAAVRAGEAGYDGIQLHAAHGYLIHQFFSPLYNFRQDAYGGSRENRARLLFEVIAEIRRAAGEHFPISVRLTGKEFTPGGYGIEDTCWIAEKLESDIQEISLSGGNFQEREWMVAPMRVEEGYLANQAQAWKDVVTKIPVSMVGRLTDPRICEGLIRDGKTDLVYLGRALLADPEWPKKAQQGYLEAIRPCISCSRCIDRLMQGLEVQCAVNPLLGREGESVLDPASRAGNVLVVGGGPAGMEAAATAAGRGHRVTLMERSSRLGGKALAAAIPPSRAAIARFTAYQERQLEITGVRVQLGHEVTAGMVEDLKPDYLVLASGGVPLRPSIPGIGQPHVFQAEDILTSRIPVGAHAIVIGGGVVGMETAEYLSELGWKVSVLEATGVLCRGEEDMTKKLLLIRVNDLGVRVFLNCRVACITRQGVLVDRNGLNEQMDADAVVIAAGYIPERGLLAEIDVSQIAVHAVGDCKEARGILEAVEEGFLVGSVL